ncbi:cell division protein FtsL [Candidatus Babeliales bacterium]|nr:cell division protein FtsL [Candidatus Babeliales bacterium]MBP9843680.1 cell division protein FtsL [Candidatus Babeliales bacterium]
MKKISAIVLFFCCNAILIFFEVHKQSKYLKLSYEIQKLQAQICDLSQQKTELIYELHNLQQPHNIQDVAVKKLMMKNIELKKIKNIDKDFDEAHQ